MVQYQPTIWTYDVNSCMISCPLLYDKPHWMQADLNPIERERLLFKRINSLKEIVLREFIFKDHACSCSHNNKFHFNESGFCISIQNPCRISLMAEGWVVRTNLLFNEIFFEIAGKFTFEEIKRFICKLLMKRLSEIEVDLELRNF